MRDNHAGIEILQLFYAGYKKIRFGAFIRESLYANAPMEPRGKRDVLAIRELERICKRQNLIGAAVRNGERPCSQFAGMALEEIFKMPIGASVELEDVLPGIADKKQFQGVFQLQHPVQDFEVDLIEVLGLIDDDKVDRVHEPACEVVVRFEVLKEEGKDII